jgi:hypothetical protein
VVSLAGRNLAIALLGATALGVTAGVTVEGWRSARGLPPMECHSDAGVELRVDAGVTSRADCQATIEHWTTVRVAVPYPVAMDAGLAPQPQVITVLVPELRLSGQVASSASLEAGVEAQATATAVVAPAAPERHWEAGPAALYLLGRQEAWLGGAAGWSAGPFGIRAEVLGGPSGVAVGASLVWRF